MQEEAGGAGAVGGDADIIDLQGAPLLIAGHSHIAAITGWCRRPTVVAEPLDGTHGLSALNGPWPRPDDYYDSLLSVLRATPGLGAALLYRGNDHLAEFLIRLEAPFDFFSTVYPDAPMDETAELVPEAMMEEHFRGLCQPVASLVSDIRAMGRAAVVMATPPPKRDDAFLRRMIGAEAYFDDKVRPRGLTGDRIPLTPPFVRLKLWGALCQVMRSLAEQAGGTFLSVPAEAMDDDGFLARKFYADDCTHANLAYGQVMLRHLSAHVLPGKPGLVG